MIDEPTPVHELVERYLLRLRAASADLPGAQRDELLGDITAHLAEAVPDGFDELTARRALDALGAPEQVAAAARAENGAVARPGAGSAQAFDVAAVLLLLLGGFVVPVLGWVAGVVMLWSSPRWAVADKWLGTLVMPGAVVVGFLSLAWLEALGARGMWFGVGVAVLGVLGWTFWRLLSRSRDALGGGAWLPA
ncbi:MULTISPECIES: HAAS signaling domain-containing protein [Pseudonocardia]|uniref:DUF1700 domain-containing protein n=2 Tax=Pseudonocardia TaxID=1847 RepID=A0A1Y2N0P0_PSEAH|nr:MULTISPECIES: hypothetical protein [Pseudonocardia]OSY40739.1 hypothetical protein BG845_02497 [Pseudonocardia autotrophica]TDN71954.1 putative membrane protein [Pseudonocardia autotrophica]BBG02641.1 hypothetical protein Pdca_38500 [Pseudonocardia autotrophica]GEC24700.1 hypothetical protein PSA01_17290 [Pseudonocardia saturnea]